MIQLILGGARSGKSSLAEQLAAKLGDDEVVYIATATVIDDEMGERIERHKQQRPSTWTSVEAPLDLAQAIEANQQAEVILVDCLTLWLNNHLYHRPEQDFAALIEQLIVAAQTTKNIIFVANEVGLGIIPMGEITRRFVDEAGRVNRKLAAQADKVIFVVAGIPQVIKGAPL